MQKSLLCNNMMHATQTWSRISQRRGANAKGRVLTYYLANFSWKLHENEENLTEKGEDVHNFTI